MSTNNMINTPEPFAASAGGTGVASPTIHTLPVAQGSSVFNFLGPLTNGQLLIGSTGADPSAAAISAGTGITVTNGAGSITIAAAGGGLSWSTVTAATLAAAINNGYILNHASTPCVVTLPATAAIGSKIAIRGLAGSGGWTATANTGQTIQFGNTSTSSGGSWSSTNAGDSCDLECIVANTTWALSNAVSSGLTVV